MSFFDPPEEPDGALWAEKRPRRPDWWDEPDTVLGGVVTTQFVLARTDTLAMAVRQIVAYPAGFSLGLIVVARDGHMLPEDGPGLTLGPRSRHGGTSETAFALGCGTRMGPSWRPAGRPDTSAGISIGLPTSIISASWTNHRTVHCPLGRQWRYRPSMVWRLLECAIASPWPIGIRRAMARWGRSRDHSDYRGGRHSRCSEDFEVHLGLLETALSSAHIDAQGRDTAFEC